MHILFITTDNDLRLCELALKNVCYRRRAFEEQPVVQMLRSPWRLHQTADCVIAIFCFSKLCTSIFNYLLAIVFYCYHRRTSVYLVAADLSSNMMWLTSTRWIHFRLMILLPPLRPTFVFYQHDGGWNSDATGHFRHSHNSSPATSCMRASNRPRTHPSDSANYCRRS